MPSETAAQTSSPANGTTTTYDALGNATKNVDVGGGSSYKVYDALGSGATGVLTGQKTPDDVLKQMDSAWR